MKHGVVTLLALSTVATTTVAHGAPRIGCICPNCFRQRRRGCHVSRRSACGCGRIGSRTTFQRSHPGTAHAGDRNQLCHQRFGRQWSAHRWIANVGDACFCPNQLPRWLPACGASSRASRATSSTACECAALHSGNTFQERLKAAVLVIARSFSIRKIRLSDAWP